MHKPMFPHAHPGLTGGEPLPCDNTEAPQGSHHWPGRRRVKPACAWLYRDETPRQPSPAHVHGDQMKGCRWVVFIGRGGEAWGAYGENSWAAFCESQKRSTLLLAPQTAPFHPFGHTSHRNASLISTVRTAERCSEVLSKRIRASDTLDPRTQEEAQSSSTVPAQVLFPAILPNADAMVMAPEVS
ncbi:hypothetical protein EJ04DRAFT_527894 [Polyplosphaeria fusca]|uniref:Uncharacterized protein n=1 Tax=Polyplosphaeria fusca TaxID=682080 RepID=A0A9P4UYK1_9PLEO|nr:hypothetical protein EJ04DRAFT_527894 [Polyplosphaeria fusca]